MAISRIGGTQGGAANAGAVTLTLPGSMAVDDLIIVAYGNADNDGTNPSLAMTTAGYTNLLGATLHGNSASGDGSLAIFYKFHNGTDTQAVCAAGGTGTDSSSAAALQVFRGVKKSAPFEVTSTTATGTSGGDPNPPSISGFTEATSAVVIAGCVASATSPLTLTAPTNYTTNAVNGTGTDTFSGSTGLAYRLTGAADPEDPGVFTDSGTGVGWAAVTMVLAADTALTVSPGLLGSAMSTFTPAISLIVYPELLGSAMAVFTPTVSTGVTISPPLVGSAMSVFAPTASLTVSPGLLGSAMSVFAPTVAETVSPPLVGSAMAVFAPAVSLTVSPGLLGSSMAVFTPAISLTVSPGLLGSSMAVFVPVVTTPGALIIEPPLLGSEMSVFAPVVIAALTVYPGLVGSEMAVFVATVGPAVVGGPLILTFDGVEAGGAPSGDVQANSTDGPTAGGAAGGDVLTLSE